MEGLVGEQMIGYRVVENTWDNVCRMISCSWSVAGVWKMYGDDEGIPRKKVRLEDNKSSFPPPSVRTRRIMRSARVGCD
jgi:hypothetical protein